MYHHKKIIISMAITMFVVNANNCPSFCTCDMSDGLRRTKCVGQRLTSLEADIPGQVQFLDLSDNAITSIPNYGFKDLNLIQVIVVNISNNMLGTISLRAFFDLNHLQTVDLSNNVLHTLAPDMFEFNKQLKRLILTGNKYILSQKSDIFLRSNSLQILDISKCFVSYMYPNLFLSLPNLISLNISNNLFIELDVSVFVSLSKLKYLNMSNNAWICNDKMAELNDYLIKKHIIYENPCDMGEKSQKMILLDEEEDESVPWLYSDDDDMETPTNDIQMTVNQTNTFTVDDEKTPPRKTLLLSIIIFSVGFVFGISVGCFCVHFLYITKGVKRKRPLTKRGEFLLEEFNDIPCGMSTPVLNRVQRFK